MERPEFCMEHYLDFLDDLSSGGMNMQKAWKPLMEIHPELTEYQARKILGYWFDTIGKDER